MIDAVRRDLGEGSWIDYHATWLGADGALMGQLIATLPLRSLMVTVHGKEHPQPRLTSWHADPGCTYRYSGLSLDPDPWTPELLELRGRLEGFCDASFNSVLANLYRDGGDAMGWHADDEPPLGRNPTIASLSLGAPRRFVLRHRQTGAKHEFALGRGSLLVMGGTTQHHWQHAVPRTAKKVEGRLNLTWRRFGRGS